MRVVNHKYAAQIAAHARAVERHARKQARLHAKIKAEAIAVAGPDSDEHHAEQLRDTDTSAEVFWAGLEDVIDMASSRANRAGYYVAAFTVPQKPFSE